MHYVQMQQSHSNGRITSFSPYFYTQVKLWQSHGCQQSGGMRHVPQLLKMEHISFVPHFFQELIKMDTCLILKDKKSNGWVEYLSVSWVLHTPWVLWCKNTKNFWSTMSCQTLPVWQHLSFTLHYWLSGAYCVNIASMWHIENTYPLSLTSKFWQQLFSPQKYNILPICLYANCIIGANSSRGKT